MRGLPAYGLRNSGSRAILRSALALIRRCRPPSSGEPARGRQPPACGPPDTPGTFGSSRPSRPGTGPRPPEFERFCSPDFQPFHFHHEV